MPNKSSVRTIQLQVHWTPPVLEVEYSTCSRCGYTWQYRGSRLKTVCNSCQTWVIVKPSVFETIKEERDKDKILVRCTHCEYEWLYGGVGVTTHCQKCGWLVVAKPHEYAAKKKEAHKHQMQYTCKYCDFKGFVNKERQSVICGSCRRYNLLREKKNTKGTGKRQKQVLEYIQRNPDVHVHKLCSELGMSLNNASGVLDSLMNMGLIKRRLVKNPRFGVVIGYTPNKVWGYSINANQ